MTDEPNVKAVILMTSFAKWPNGVPADDPNPSFEVYTENSRGDFSRQWCGPKRDDAVSVATALAAEHGVQVEIFP